MTFFRFSLLQARILLELDRRFIGNITELATALNLLRPSVSRSMRQMEKRGRVEWGQFGWSLTETGKSLLPTAKKMVAKAYNDSLKLAEGLTFSWEDYTAGFDCPCGIKEIILSDSGESKQCDCGRVYQLVAYVAIGDSDLRNSLEGREGT